LLSPRDPARTEVMARAATAYGVSVWTIYRALRELTRPKSVRRSDHGSTRAAPAAEMERYAEIIAALKIRTSNKKGRHLSTARAIRLLEEDGVETPEGLVRAPAGLLKRATVDRVLRASGLDYVRVTRPVAAVRFQAKRSNELWQFDMSPSDLKQVEVPLWVEAVWRRRPSLPDDPEIPPPPRAPAGARSWTPASAGKLPRTSSPAVSPVPIWRASATSVSRQFRASLPSTGKASQVDTADRPPGGRCSRALMSASPGRGSERAA
jgi:hypothetical protein